MGYGDSILEKNHREVIRLLEDNKAKMRPSVFDLAVRNITELFNHANWEFKQANVLLAASAKNSPLGPKGKLDSGAAAQVEKQKVKALNNLGVALVNMSKMVDVEEIREIDNQLKLKRTSN
jgi:hypothetical protein